MMCGRKRDAPTVGGERKTLKIFENGKSQKLVLHILPPAPQSKIKIVSSVQSASAVNNYAMVQLFGEDDWTLLHSELTPTARATSQCQGFLPIG